MPKDMIPNAETVAALKEIEAGGGEVYRGTTEEMLEKILSEDDEPVPGAGQSPPKKNED